MKAADTSLLVAAFASWHEHHTAARRLVERGIHLIEHCALETYSVLTRLPPPHRCPGEVVRDWLRVCFGEPWLRLDTQSFRRFVLELPEHRASGGATYDALVAATAVAHGAQLVTCDLRASELYKRYQVKTDFIG